MGLFPAPSHTMETLSESTKKEKRNLLAAGFAGLIVGLLKVYPTEISLAGVKLHNPDLPLIAVGALCVAIIYLLTKFILSYLYEQASTKTQTLAIQIREEKTPMDIAREEKALADLERHLFTQGQVLPAQQAHEERRLGALQEKIDRDDLAFVAAQKTADKELADFRRKFDETNQPIAREFHAAVMVGVRVLPPHSEPEDLQERIKSAEADLAKLEESRRKARQDDVQSLENEKNHRREVQLAVQTKFDSDVAAADRKKQAIIEWKTAHATFGIVSPLHRTVEVYLPIGVGVLAIVSLLYLMLHFPNPKPPSLPDF